MEHQDTKHCFIAHQEIGDAFSGVYYVEQIYVKLTQQGKEYTDMMLRDRSGSRNVKIWTRLDEIEKGNWIFISALVEGYHGSASIIAKNVEKEEEPDNLGNYIPVYQDVESLVIRFDELKEEMVRLSDVVGDKTCVRLVDQVYRSSKLFSKFIECPGSSRPHYGCVGGLLANTVRVTDAAFRMSEQYALTEMETMILLAAGLIHRIGTIDTYEFVDCMPVITKSGHLLGVSNLTLTRVAEALKRTVKHAQENDLEVNSDVFLRVLHAVLSYDELFVKPMTKEALVLSAAYRGDRDVVDAMDFIDEDLNGDEFTAYDSKNQRRYYTGSIS